MEILSLVLDHCGKIFFQTYDLRPLPYIPIELDSDFRFIDLPKVMTSSVSSENWRQIQMQGLKNWQYFTMNKINLFKKSKL